MGPWLGRSPAGHSLCCARRKSTRSGGCRGPSRPFHVLSVLVRSEWLILKRGPVSCTRPLRVRMYSWITRCTNSLSLLLPPLVSLSSLSPPSAGSSLLLTALSLPLSISPLTSPSCSFLLSLDPFLALRVPPSALLAPSFFLSIYLYPLSALSSFHPFLPSPRASSSSSPALLVRRSPSLSIFDPSSVSLGSFPLCLASELEASWSCYNPESADGRPMYGSLFYAGCAALRCTPRGPRSRLETRGPLHLGRNTRYISTASLPAFKRPSARNTVAGHRPRAFEASPQTGSDSAGTDSKRSSLILRSRIT